MSTVIERYLNYWYSYAKKNQSDLDLIDSEFEQINRVWQILTGQDNLSLTNEEREKIILNLTYVSVISL